MPVRALPGDAGLPAGVTRLGGLPFNPVMPNADTFREFTVWCEQLISGDEQWPALSFPDRLFQAFGRPGHSDFASLVTADCIRPTDSDGDPANGSNAQS